METLIKSLIMQVHYTFLDGVKYIMNFQNNWYSSSMVLYTKLCRTDRQTGRFQYIPHTSFLEIHIKIYAWKLSCYTSYNSSWVENGTLSYPCPKIACTSRKWPCTCIYNLHINKPCTYQFRMQQITTWNRLDVKSLFKKIQYHHLVTLCTSIRD